LRKYGGGRTRTIRTSENSNGVEELALTQEDALAHEMMRHFEHRNDIIVNLTFPYGRGVNYSPPAEPAMLGARRVKGPFAAEKKKL